MYIIIQMDNTVFVSYYTDNKPYNIYIHNLENSLKKFNLNYEIKRKVPQSLGNNWYTRASYKPIFILEMMDKYPDKNICWLDADSVIIQYPNELLNCDCDVTSIFKDITDKNNFKYVMTSLILFKNNDNSKNFVKIWSNKTSEYGASRKYADQDTFYDTYKEIDNISYGTLSLLKYCWLCITPNGKDLLNKNIYDHVSIVQFQASRLKNNANDKDVKYENLQNIDFKLYPLTLNLKQINNKFEITGDKNIWTLHGFFKEIGGTLDKKKCIFQYNPKDEIVKILPKTIFK